METKKIKNWTPLAIFILLAIFIRWSNNFSTTLIPGINGGYYALQIKSLGCLLVSNNY